MMEWDTDWNSAVRAVREGPRLLLHCLLFHVVSRDGPSGVRIDNHHSPGILLCGEPKVVSTVSMRLL